MTLNYCRRCLSYFHATQAHPSSWRKVNKTRRGWSR